MLFTNDVWAFSQKNKHIITVNSIYISTKLRHGRIVKSPYNTKQLLKVETVAYLLTGMPELDMTWIAFSMVKPFSLTANFIYSLKAHASITNPLQLNCPKYSNPDLDMTFNIYSLLSRHVYFNQNNLR